MRSISTTDSVTFALNLVVVSECRACDLFTTWLASPDLRHEINPIIRWLGWRGTLLVNAVLCPVAALENGPFFYCLCIFSLLGSMWNTYLWTKKK
jgi:hypothetical protein